MKNYRIGIDAGGTKVAYGLFDEQNNLLDRFQHLTPIEADGPTFSDLVIENVRKCFEAEQHDNRGTAGYWHMHAVIYSI